MEPRQASPTVLLILLCAAVCLANLVVLMLGPLLVELAYEFQTSVAIVGQLATATALTWGIVAPLAGPVSDTYGRRRMLLADLLLMALGILGSVLAWNYGALLTLRSLTGVGAAMVPPQQYRGDRRYLPAHRARQGDRLVGQCHGDQRRGGGPAGGLLAGCWGIETALKVRDSAAFLAQLGLRRGTTATR